MNILPHLSIFDTFKTKSDELTGEAVRQRSIIVCLATQTNPIDRTRTSISQQIAEESGIVWKNIYSGIFRDLDEVLIPLGLVSEEGRLPLKRGPRALQEKGIPYYQLTHKGLLVPLALSEIIGREKILQDFLSHAQNEERELISKLEKLSKIAPRLAFYVFEKYVKSYCKGEFNDLVPFSLAKFKKLSDESVKMSKELVKGFSSLSKWEKEEIIQILDSIE